MASDTEEASVVGVAGRLVLGSKGQDRVSLLRNI